jgi:hypothetical protein
VISSMQCRRSQNVLTLMLGLDDRPYQWLKLNQE